jgi:uncharacterized RDD family membrane protein YckC
MIHRFLFPFGPKPLPEGPRYGDMYERSLAAAIDLTLIFMLLKDVLFYPLSHFIYSFGNQAEFNAMPRDVTFGQFMQVAWETQMAQLWLLNASAQLLVIGFFMVGFQITYATTPGKWLLGLKVVRHDSDAPVGPWRYIVRFFAYCVACLPLMLGMFWAMFNKERRGWHDYIAGTMVIHTRPRGWYWQKVKQGFRWVWGKLSGARAVENAVAQPPAEQGDKDGDKPV